MIRSARAVAGTLASLSWLLAPSAKAGSTITPFGYGTVGQYLVQSSDPSQTGAQWCATKYGTASAPWRCLSVTGGSGLTDNSCGATVPANEIVSCSPFTQIMNISASDTAVGQTGRWWCNDGLGLNIGSFWQCLNVNGSAAACSNTVSQGQVVACGAYSVVHDTGLQYPGFMSTPELYQVRPKDPMQSGQAWCDSKFSTPRNATYSCRSVDLGGNCNATVGAGSVVSCSEIRSPIALASPYASGQTPYPGQTGSWLCSQTAINQSVYKGLTGYGWGCVNMRDANNNVLSCSNLINPGTTSYCQPTYDGSTIETANCNSPDLGALDAGFCPVKSGAYLPTGLQG